jgi:hypothetical protein
MRDAVTVVMLFSCLDSTIIRLAIPSGKREVAFVPYNSLLAHDVIGNVLLP